PPTIRGRAGDRDRGGASTIDNGRILAETLTAIDDRGGLVATGESLEAQLEARDPDVRLMLQIRDDVPGAFEVLVERYQHRLVGVLTHLIGKGDEAEDLTQDVFLRIYRARKGY